MALVVVVVRVVVVVVIKAIIMVMAAVMDVLGLPVLILTTSLGMAVRAMLATFGVDAIGGEFENQSFERCGDEGRDADGVVGFHRGDGGINECSRDGGHDGVIGDGHGNEQL